MKQRGRKAAAALEVASIGRNGITTVRRPGPPAELSDEMAEEWRRIVNGKPSDWFDAGAQPVLVQFCRHILAARRVGQLIAQQEASEDYDVDRHLALLRAQERQTAAIKAAATSLRLTPQSRYTPGRAASAAGNEISGAKPWKR